MRAAMNEYLEENIQDKKLVAFKPGGALVQTEYCGFCLGPI